MLSIPKPLVDDIFDHALNGLPEEICGYLAGTGREVTRVFRMTNIDHSPEHFSFDPAEQFQVLRAARKEGLEILANYHSHPGNTCPAIRRRYPAGLRSRNKLCDCIACCSPT